MIALHRHVAHFARSVVAAALAALAGGASSPSYAQGGPERGAFLLVTGKDTVVIDRFSRTADTLIGSISAKGQGRADYVVALGPGNTVRTITLTLFRGAGADEQPLQTAVATMRGDSAIVDVRGALQRIGTKAGAIPSINNAFAIFELFTRRMRSAGHDLEVPYFALSGGVTIPVSLKPIGADSIVASLAGTEQRMRVDNEGRILGGVIVGQGYQIIRVTADAAASLKVGRMDYSPPPGAPYTAEEVSLKGQGGIELGGTLTLPKSVTGRVPAIVTITGSGQQDRDESIPIVPGGYRPFRQVADTLGRRGIAVLRLDDRMIGASGGKEGTSADYAEDIRAALAYLRTRPEIDPSRLGVLGHSEGGLIGPLVGAAEPSLKVVVALAGPAYKGRDIILYQQRYAIDHDSTARAQHLSADSLARMAKRGLDSLAAASVWFKYFLDYDPIPTAKKVKAATLILQGETDRQVTPEQAQKLGDAIRSGGNRNVTVRLFPGLNHLFIPDPDGNPSGYTRLKTNKVTAEVLGVIADWLVLKLAAKPTM